MKRPRNTQANIDMYFPSHNYGHLEEKRLFQCNLALNTLYTETNTGYFESCQYLYQYMSGDTGLNTFADTDTADTLYQYQYWQMY